MSEEERIEILEHALHQAYEFLEGMPSYPYDLKLLIEDALGIEF
mgnify:CR=1 FL=1